MAHTSAAGKVRASTEAARLCEDLLRECAVSAVHIEMRDAYTPGDPWFRAWLDGDQPEFEGRLERQWLNLIRSVTGRGVTVRRLRVVSEPVSDYIRFEHATTDSNIAAGEQVRWLPRRLAADLLLPGCDCWVFDSRTVLFNLFGGAGEWAGVSLCDDPDVGARHAAAFGTAWDRGIPHAGYRLA